MHRCKNEYSMTYEKHTQSQVPYGHMLKQCYITYMALSQRYQTLWGPNINDLLKDLDRPAQNLHLIPTAHLWAELKERVTSHHSMAELDPMGANPYIHDPISH